MCVCVCTFVRKEDASRPRGCSYRNDEWSKDSRGTCFGKENRVFRDGNGISVEAFDNGVSSEGRDEEEFFVFESRVGWIDRCRGHFSNKNSWNGFSG